MRAPPPNPFPHTSKSHAVNRSTVSIFMSVNAKRLFQTGLSFLTADVPLVRSARAALSASMLLWSNTTQIVILYNISLLFHTQHQAIWQFWRFILSKADKYRFRLFYPAVWKLLCFFSRKENVIKTTTLTPGRRGQFRASFAMRFWEARIVSFGLHLLRYLSFPHLGSAVLPALI